MDLLLITVEKRLDTGLTAQIGVSGEEGDKILVSKFNTPVGIDVKEGLIDLLRAKGKDRANRTSYPRRKSPLP